MGENHLTSCAKNHSCTNTYSNVIVSFRNPESKAAGPRLATPTATCFTTREARRRRQRNQEPKSKQRNAPHLYQTPPPIKVAANLQGGGQGSASAAPLSGCRPKLPPLKMLCHVRHRSGYNQVFGEFQKLLQCTCFIDPRCPVRLAVAETWKLVLSKGTLGRLTSYHVAGERCVPSSGIPVDDR